MSDEDTTVNSPQILPLPSIDRLVPRAATAGQEDRMREAMSDQIGPRLDQILARLDALEARLAKLENEPRSIPEYLPRG